MIVTVFGDVHGNLIALEKLFQIEKNETDLFISHGDLVNYGPWSNECVAFLKSVSNITLLKGNHEEFYINGYYKGENEIANAFFDFCFPKFNPDLIKEISTYQEKTTIPNFTIQHTIFDQYIFADTNLTNKVDKNFIIGHSHQQYHIKNNNFDIYNTGSLGQNRSLLNLSCYLKIDTVKKTVVLKNFIHNTYQVIQQMKSDKYPKICIDYYLSKNQV